jgi:outer membrane immunogenic protein
MRQGFHAGLALAACAVAIVVTPPQAGAADMQVRKPVLKAPPAPVAAAYDWSGFYAGVHGGGAWVHKNFVDFTSGNPLNEGDIDAAGWLAGGQAGFNWQVRSWVFGIEADGSFADVSGERQSLVFDTDRVTMKTRGFGTIAGRLGYAVDNMLVFAKGGAAWSRDRYAAVDIASGTTIGSVDDTRWGWMAGGGIEYGLARDWSLKLEYDYLDFGAKSYVNVPCTPGFCSSFDQTITQHIQVVKAGLNYRFGGPSAVVAR